MAFARDVCTAAFWSMLGGPLGWFACLCTAAVAYNRWPGESVYVTFSFAPIAGLLAGLITGTVLRTFVGRVTYPRVWASSFFALGVVIPPLTLIAIINVIFIRSAY